MKNLALFLQMDDNPWLVDSIHSFSVFKCPECIFNSKEEENFHNHAIQNHPLSFVFFGKPKVEMITEEKSTDLPEKIEVLENSFQVEDNESSFEMEEYNENSFEVKYNEDPFEDTGYQIYIDTNKGSVSIIIYFWYIQIMKASFAPVHD